MPKNSSIRKDLPSYQKCEIIYLFPPKKKVNSKKLRRHRHTMLRQRVLGLLLLLLSASVIVCSIFGRDFGFDITPVLFLLPLGLFLLVTKARVIYPRASKSEPLRHNCGGESALKQSQSS